MLKSSLQSANQVLNSKYKSLKTKTIFYRQDDKTLGYLLISFVLWPFGTFLYALYYYTHKDSRIILILFTALFGFCMIADSEGLDLYRYLDKLKEYISLSFSEFIRLISGTYSADSKRGAVDLYVDLSAFLISRFTSSGSVLMMFFGLVYGFAYAKSLSLLLTFNRLKNRFTIIILICFSFIMGLDQLAGVRFGTGAYLFFAGSFNLLNDKKRIGWLYILSAVFIHFGYIPGALLILFFPIFGKNKWLIYGITIISFLIPNLLHNFILQFSSELEGGISNRANIYTKIDGSSENINSQIELVWFVKYRFTTILYYSYFAIIVILFKFNQLRTNIFSNKLLYFTLLIISVSNFTILVIPVFGGRYQVIYLMFFMGYLYHLYSLNKNSIIVKYLAYGTILASLFQIVYVLRCFLFYTPASLFYGNLGMIFISDDASTVWSIIKGI